MIQFKLVLLHMQLRAPKKELKVTHILTVRIYFHLKGSKVNRFVENAMLIVTQSLLHLDSGEYSYKHRVGTTKRLGIIILITIRRRGA